jgi:hypothetical protein
VPQEFHFDNPVNGLPAETARISANVGRDAPVCDEEKAICVEARDNVADVTPDGCGRCRKPRPVRFSIAFMPSSFARRSYAAGLICPIVECRRPRLPERRKP